MADRSIRRALEAALCLLLIAGFPPWAHADADASGDTATVNAFAGRLETKVPIGVPPFRGMEPRLSLEYSSSGANGFLGLGWNLIGASSIELASPGRGSPRYDGNDIYLFDGMELVRCESGMTSPGCTTGGTHATRVESYTKIQFESATNRWYVWSKDGTKATYGGTTGSTFGTSGGTFRWLISSRVDTTNSTVTYNNWCDGASPATKDCYLDSITYNGNTIKFYRELRTDDYTFATGRSLGLTQYRLKSVTVSVGGSLARAYQLGYAYVTVNGAAASIVTSVQQFGRDATVNTSTGQVSGGTSLPAAGYTWGHPGTYGTEAALGALYYETDDDSKRKTLGDLNGDGRSDYFYEQKGTNTLRARLSTGTALGAETVWGTRLYSIAAAVWSLGDFNGDGKDDFIYQRQDTKEIRVLLSTGTAFGAETHWATLAYNPAADKTAFWIKDLNGDGKMDFVYRRDDSKEIRALLSTGAGFAAETIIFTRAYNENSGESWFVDLDGDGLPDHLYQRDGTQELRARLNNFGHGSSTFAAESIWAVRQYGKDRTELADLNGDGRADFIYERDGTSEYRVLLSQGNAFGPETSWGTRTYGIGGDGTQWWVLDMDGDNLADVVYQRDGVGTEFRIQRSTGVGLTADTLFFTRTYSAQGSGSKRFNWFIDLNGDGRPDHLYRQDGTLNLRWRATTGQPVSLVTGITNGLGGSTTVSYTPSSTWVNTYLPSGTVFPTVASVSISDGRGDIRTTSYTYAGARWLDLSKEFLGFRKASTIQGAGGAYSETYYWQRAGTIAKPEVIYKRKADGSIMSFEKFMFTESTTAPFTSLVTQMWGYECNGDGVVDANNNYVSGCKRTLTTYSWDVYGNLTAEFQYGDYDDSTDDRTAVRSFAPNTSAYIVGLPTYEEMRSGLSVSGTLLTRFQFYYDNAASIATPPTVGALTKKSQWNDQTGLYLSHTFAYDAYGNETSVTDPMGRTSRKEWDPTYHAYVTATVNPLGHRVENTYDYVLAQPLTKRDANLATETHAYDALGRATLTTGPDGSQIAFAYVGFGSPSAQYIRQSNLLPGSSWYYEDNYFDGVGRGYKKVGANGVTEETLYGATGKVWKRSVPYVAGETVRYDEFLYDDLGRQTKVTYAGGATATHTYGDFTALATDAVGTQRWVVKDGHGRVKLVGETIDGTWKYTWFYYDRLGRRTSATDPVGAVTAASYDSLGRMLQKSDPNHGLWTYTYNDGGQLLTERDALLQTTTLSYDSLGRVTRRLYPDGTADSFTFDQAGYGASKGRLTTSTSASGVTSRAYYDAVGRRTRLAQTIDGGTYTVSHTYDVAGRVSSMTYPDGEVLTYAYGTSGTAWGKLVGVGNKVTAATYTSRGQVASLTYGNGLSTSFAFDTNGEKTTQIAVGSLLRVDYGYDLNGRVTSMRDAVGGGETNWTYGYDSIGRLTRATNLANAGHTQTFSYDAGGRMLTNSLRGSYTYGSSAHRHAVTQAGPNTYAYDANGNLTAGAGRVLAYDYGHRPVSITAGGLQTSFVYDAQGLRVKKSSAQGTVIYVGGVYEKRGTAVTKYYYAGGLRVAKSDANGVSYIHTDHLGSTRLVTNAAGADVKRYHYRPFGEVLAEPGTQPESHRFTGQEADDETGLVFFQARYYDPALGRFIQPDPIIPDPNNPQDLDAYAYANNSPVVNVDPSGHATVVAVVTAIAAFVAAHATACAIAAVVIGAALTFTKSPILQTIGMILAGIGGAYLAGPLIGLSVKATMAVGAAVALAQSPISPLDPTIKKAIGWAYTMWGGFTSLATATAEAGGGVWGAIKAIGKSIAWEVGKTVVVLAVAAAVSKWGGTFGRYLLAFLGRYMVLGGYLGTYWGIRVGGSWPGALSMIGSTYDLVYTLRYPDGRTIDLSGGEGGETFTFYYHTGYESPLALGRQHIRVGDPGGGFWELGDARAGWFGPGLGWGSWIGTQKVKVIMNANQAAAFRAALEAGAKKKGVYVGMHKDSYTYISMALKLATGKSAANLHINPGLIHW